MLLSRTFYRLFIAFIASLLLVEDFEAFSKMMTQRALEQEG